MRFRILFLAVFCISMAVVTKRCLSQSASAGFAPANDGPAARNLPGTAEGAFDRREASADVSSSPPSKFKVAIIRLKKISAAHAAITLEELFTDQFERGMRLNVNPRQNLLTIRGPEETIVQFEALLQELEDSAAGANPYVMDQMVVPPRKPRAEPSALVGILGLQQQILTVEANAYQQRISELTSKYELLSNPESEGFDPNSDRTEKVADELKTVVEEIFDKRHQRQQQQVRQLMQRLEALQRRVKDRQNNRQQIIEQSVDELLSSAGKATDLLSQRLLGQLARPKSTTADTVLQQWLSQTHREVDAREAVLQTQLAELRQAEQMMKKGYISKSRFDELQNRVRLSEDQMAADRVNLTTNVKRREVELRQAELDLKIAAEELEIARKLIGSGAGSTSELREFQLKQDQAKLKLERANLELDAAASQLQTIKP